MEREQILRQLESLSARLTTAQEEERGRIAYELHEELGQELLALTFYLKILERGNTGQQGDSPQKQALAMAVHATERVRRLVLDLEPRELEDFGLDAAVRAYCQRLVETDGWHPHIDVPKPETRAPRPVERACFRVLQESLSNVLQHAKASEVWVQIRQDPYELVLVVRDNGVGFDRYAIRDSGSGFDGSLGLFAMQLRAKNAGGSVVITSAPGMGTEVQAVFPLQEASVAAD
jgi:signal transduction histidine kinase